MQIHISKITHRDAQRLRVEIPYTNHNLQQIKQIPGATFSRTLNSWHIPFTKDAYSKLSALFPHDEFIKAESTQPDEPKLIDLIQPPISIPSSSKIPTPIPEPTIITPPVSSPIPSTPVSIDKSNQPQDSPKSSVDKPIPNSIKHPQTNSIESSNPQVATNPIVPSSKPQLASIPIVPSSKPQVATIPITPSTKSNEQKPINIQEVSYYEQSSMLPEPLAPDYFSGPINRNSITLEVAARRLILRMPKNDTDVQFVLTFNFTVWNPGIKAWIIPNFRSNGSIQKSVSTLIP